MKKKIIFPVIISIILGIVSAKILYDNYEKKKESNNNIYNSYLLQVGVYTDKHSLKQATKNLNNYIVKEENGKYYVYVGMTTSKDNANKIKKAYQNKDVDLYIKEDNINNVEFISSLEQYDVLLNGVSKDKDIISINEVILSTYEEMVMGQ